MNESVERMIREPMDWDEFMTAPEVARYLRMSVKWVYAHAQGRRKPVLVAHYFGRAVRFKRSDVDRFVDRLRRDQQQWAQVH